LKDSSLRSIYGIENYSIGNDRFRGEVEIAMIEVSDLSKTYGDYAAVSKVSFSAAKGDIVGFLGPNGAGKTTTIRMLATYLPPSSGSASIAGFDILREADEVRKHIGYLPENPPLYPEMTVHEYLKFIAEIKGVPRAKIQERISEVIEQCFITDVRNKLCQHLSRGYRQRVGLAQAIIHDPEVIILDEPTSGLDPKQIIDIRKLIHSLGESHTVVLSTHILPEVSMLCNKVVIISNGRVVIESELGDLTKDKDLEQIFIESVSREENMGANGSPQAA
jgi:ABC-2 type transport system ATP-binding protein